MELSKDRNVIVKTVYRARRAEQLIRTQIWQDITDALADRQTTIAVEAMWNMDDSVDKSAMKSAMASGRSAEIEHLAKLLDRWIRDGREASKKLKEWKIEI